MKIDSGYWRDWEVWLEDDKGKRLPEYRIEQTPPKGLEKGTVKLHIKCKEDQYFTLFVKRPRVGARVECAIDTSIDGRRPEEWVFDLREDLWWQDCSLETIDGVVLLRALRFKKLERNENGPAIPDEVAQALGTITVMLESGVSVNTKVSIPSAPEDNSPLIVLDETIRKGEISALVGGELVGVAGPDQLCDWVPDPLAPWCEVQFTYGTRQHLMAKGIIPKPKSASKRAKTQNAPAGNKNTRYPLRSRTRGRFGTPIDIKPDAKPDIKPEVKDIKANLGESSARLSLPLLDPPTAQHMTSDDEDDIIVIEQPKKRTLDVVDFLDDE